MSRLTVTPGGVAASSPALARKSARGFPRGARAGRRDLAGPRPLHRSRSAAAPSQLCLPELRDLILRPSSCAGETCSRDHANGRSVTGLPKGGGGKWEASVRPKQRPRREVREGETGVRGGRCAERCGRRPLHLPARGRRVRKTGHFFLATTSSLDRRSRQTRFRRAALDRHLRPPPPKR